MSAVLPGRRYQLDAIDALEADFAAGQGNRYAVVLPTGTGKTVTFGIYAAKWLEEHPGERVLFLVDTDELVRQTVATLLKVAPDLRVGVVKAAENETDARAIVASVQTLARPDRREQITDVGLIIVDECEAAVSPTYQAVLAHYGAFDGRALVAGFTATLQRGDGQSLGRMWQGVSFSRSTSWAVRQRFLVPPIGLHVTVPDLDLTGMGRSNGDYAAGELGDALAESLAPELIAQTYLEHAAGRRGLGYTSTVDAAYVFAHAFNAAGIPTGVVHGGLPIAGRRLVLAAHRAGHIQVVFNAMLLTKGYDDPGVSAIVQCRPTQSARLSQQIIGRGLRVDPDLPYDGQDCLVIFATPGRGGVNLRSLIDLSDRPLVEAKDGKTLIELEDEWDLGAGLEPDAEHFYRGPVEVTEFDLLAAGSSKAWKRTKGGAHFLAGGKQAFVFLLPDGEGTYAVAWCMRAKGVWRCSSRLHDPECMDRHGKPGGTTRHRGLNLELAMGWAEDLAADMGTDVGASKTAAWRREPANEDMKSLARALGIDVAMVACHGKGGAGKLSDRMDIVVATRRVDPIIVKHQQRRESLV